MGYTWTDGELITATKLNNTGGGCFDVGVADGVLDKTWTEILTALSGGDIVRIVENGEDFATCYYVFAVNTDEEFWYVYVVGSDGWYQASSASGYPEFAE